MVFKSKHVRLSKEKQKYVIALYKKMVLEEREDSNKWHDELTTDTESVPMCSHVVRKNGSDILYRATEL